MNDKAPTADPIDRAIVAAASEPGLVPITGQLMPSGRPYQLLIPADITPKEALSLVAAVADIQHRLEQQQRSKNPASDLVAVRGSLPKV